MGLGMRGMGVVCMMSSSVGYQMQTICRHHIPATWLSELVSRPVVQITSHDSRSHKLAPSSSSHCDPGMARLWRTRGICVGEERIEPSRARHILIP
jgi:hypothetical protein